MEQTRQRKWGRVLYLVLAAVALGNSGCLLAAAGVAAGGAAGYAYSEGLVCRTYEANFEDVWAAAHTALAELQLPVDKEEQNEDDGVIQSRTADKDRIRIYLETRASRVPADGSVTRVCIRVATFGDHPLSQRILDQIGFHLVPPGMVGQPPASPPLPATIQPASLTIPAQTAPPPELPPEPGKKP